MKSENKTVITGVGMVTSLGLNVESTWESVKAGKSGVREISLFNAKKFETQIAAEVSLDFEESAKKIISSELSDRMTRTTRMAMVAADEAIKDSKIAFNDFNKARIAVILGVITSSYNELEQNKNDEHMILKSLPNAPSAWISLKYGLEGPSFNVSTACASSSYALGLGNQMIKSGLVDIVIAGGVDSHIDPNCINGFNQILALSIRNDTPQSACRPFSKTRDGFVMGEGAGIVVLESETIAKERKAQIYGELAGFAITSEANDITAPKENGVGMANTMKMALENAGVEPADVGYINAHGTSTYLNDKYETLAIKECFGDNAKQIGISSTKSMHGHTLGAAGAIEGIITLLSIKNNVMPPTINLYDKDLELDLDYVPNYSRDKTINIALSNSFGFGGHNATLVFKKY